MAPEQVHFHVSGHKFSIDRSCLAKGPNSRLKTLSEDQSTCSHVFNKPPEVFGAVMALYQTGKLHIPPIVCPGAFISDLKFWEIDIKPDMLPSCCSQKLKVFLDEQKTLQRFRQTEVHTHHDGVKPRSSATRFRGRLWAILDYRERTIPSRVFFTLALFMVLISIFTLAFSTDTYVRDAVSNCELINAINAAGMNDLVAGLLGRRCSSEQTSENLTNNRASPLIAPYNASAGKTNVNVEEYLYPTDNDSSGPSSGSSDSSSMSSIAYTIYALVFAELATLLFFTLEFILRLMSCPDIRKYFKSVINIIDAAALIGTYLHMLIIRVQVESVEIDRNEWLDVLEYMQMLRSFRLFRIVKNIKASRVLTYSLRQNLKDLSILALFLAVMTCTFASLVYILEDQSNIESVPVAWYWAVITMTTVGYGDVSPKSKAGRLVGCICATFGVMLFALTVPLFANRFITLYNYIALEDICIEKELKSSESEDALLELEISTSENRNGAGHAEHLKDAEVEPNISMQKL